MDEDRIAGTARKLGGKIQEDVGRFAGDTQTQIKGVANQAAGTAQDSVTPSKLSHIRPL